MNSRAHALRLILPALLALFVLFYLPQAIMFLVSFGTRSAYGAVEYGFDIHNYLRVFDPLYLTIFGRSLLLALSTTILCLLAGYPLAWWIGRVVREKYRTALLTLVILPFWTSFLVRMYAWIVLLRSEGVVNQALTAAGLPRLDLLYNSLAVLIGQVYGELPFMIVPLYVSITKLDGDLLEAAADCGASPLRTFFTVVVPQTLPGIFAGCVLVFVPSLGAYLAPDLLGGGKTAYIGNLIQNQFAAARDMPFGAALSFVLSLVVIVLLVLFRKPLRSARETG